MFEVSFRSQHRATGGEFFERCLWDLSKDNGDVRVRNFLCEIFCEILAKFLAKDVCEIFRKMAATG